MHDCAQHHTQPKVCHMVDQNLHYAAIFMQVLLARACHLAGKLL